MKKITPRLTLLLLFLMPLATVAQKLYCVYTADNKTLTFYYDTKDNSRDGTVYTYTTDYEPAWLEISGKVDTVVFDPSVKNARPTTCANWFKNFTYMSKIEGLEYLNTSQVTRMDDMFFHCLYLTELNITNFDTRNVTNIDEMFRECYRLESLDLSNFSTSKVTLMWRVFMDCRKLKTLDLSNFDVSHVEAMVQMFYNCEDLRTIYCNDDWQAESRWGQEIFNGCMLLTGGNGTALYKENENGSYTLLIKDYESYARPDEDGNPGLFTKKTLTIGGYYVKNGLQHLDCIKSGTVTYSEDDNELTLNNAVIETQGDGIFAPEGLYLVLKGTSNSITSYGNGITSLGGDNTITGQGDLSIVSCWGYGISVEELLEISGKGKALVGLSVQGERGAIDGRKRWSNYYSAYRYGSISFYNASVNLSSHATQPVLHDIGSVDDSNMAYNYWNYYFDDDRRTIVDGSTLDRYGEPVTVTKPFKVVPKDMLQNTTIELGGKYINNHNFSDFYPMSLKSGYVYLSGTTLVLEDTRFKTNYIPTDDNYALYAKMNDLTIRLVGDNDLVGTSDDYDYGIWLKQQDSGNQCNWTISSQDGAKLNINGDIFMNNDNPDSKLTIDNVDITCKDYCHFWCEDDVNVEIVNSSLELWDKEYGRTSDFSWNLMGTLETLTLKDCHFEDGCYWNPTREMVFNSDGKPETYHLKIARGEGTSRKGDVNNDDKINTADVVAVYFFIEKGTASSFTRAAADVNGDSAVNTADVVAIYDIIIKGGQ